MVEQKPSKQPIEKNTPPKTRTSRTTTGGRTRATPLEGEPTKNQYRQLGEFFLMDASQRAVVLAQIPAEDTTTRQIIDDAQLLRELAEGKLFMKGTEEGNVFLQNQTVKDPEAITYVINLLEETPGVPQEQYHVLHVNLTTHLRRIHEGIAEAHAVAKKPTTAKGLPQRGGRQPLHGAFSPEEVPTGVDKFLADRVEPQEPPQNR